MMGRRNRDQDKLFYEFRLDDRIPESHLLRRMNVFVTLSRSVTCTRSWQSTIPRSAGPLLILNS
jgi:hypothetical protein